MTILFIFLFLILILIWIQQSVTIDKSVKYYRFGEEYDVEEKSKRVGKTFELALQENLEGRMTRFEDANLIFLYNLDDMDRFIKVAESKKNIEVVFGLRSINFFASKSHLNMILERFLSEDEIRKTLPRTIPAYIIKDGKHRKERIKMIESQLGKGPYILKTNRQRQQGIHIVMNPVNVIKRIEEENYSVVQELLHDPFLINDRKINIRVYIGIVKHPSKKLQINIYHDGFVYYTPSKFDDENASMNERHITTGYIDRSIYEENPLTLMDLRDHVGMERYGEIWKDVERVIKNIENAYDIITRNMEKGGSFTRFAIMGVDFAVMSDLSVRLMEINKNPDTRGKDDRDENLKKEMITYFFTRIFKKDII